MEEALLAVRMPPKKAIQKKATEKKATEKKATEKKATEKKTTKKKEKKATSGTDEAPGTVAQMQIRCEVSVDRCSREL